MTCAVEDVMLFTQSHYRRRVNSVDLRCSHYDPDLQWFVERRLLEHGPAGVPCGDFFVRSARSGPSVADSRAA
jgi:hypothetical protein